MIDNIKFESFKIQDNIIIIENELMNIYNNEIISSDNKERFNQFIRWRI